MSRSIWLAAAALACAPTALAAQASLPANGLVPGAGLEFSASTDSDHTDIVKLLGSALWRFEGRDHYQGIALERAWFGPRGQGMRSQTRAYLDLADDLGSQWKWRARVGTNGHTILGSASLRTADWRQEFFLERDLVETPIGLDKGIYYSFAGASRDLLAGDRDTVNAMAGVQAFTGRNVRLHLRGNYVHAVRPALGLSVQLRTRYFHSTVPHEFDYYSPRDYVQLVPVVQMRRFDRSGWMYLLAVGYGAQKASGGGWQAARLADLRIESPAASRKLHAFVQLQYSNNSLNQGGGGYHYVAARAGVTAGLR
jgi:hypothetical protein